MGMVGSNGTAASILAVEVLMMNVRSIAGRKGKVQLVGGAYVAATTSSRNVLNSTIQKLVQLSARCCSTGRINLQRTISRSTSLSSRCRQLELHWGYDLQRKDTGVRGSSLSSWSFSAL